MKRYLHLPFKILVVILLSYSSSCNFTGRADKEESSQIDEDSYVGGELAVQHGMELFNQHCASCHNFRSNEIGPNLSGVTSEVDKAWLTTFIKDPTATIKNGDERAVALFDKYKIYMPSFPTLEGEDLEDLLGFIHKFSEAEKRSQNSRPGALLDPIPEKIPEPDMTLVIEELLTVPPSSDSNLKTRINTMSAIKTEQGERLFLSDLRGKLHELVDTTVRVYLNVEEELKNFIDNPGRASGLGSFAFHPEFEINGLLYTTHTEPSRTAIADFAIHDSIRTTLQWVLTEWKANNPKSSTFSGEKREVLRADMVGGGHGFQEVIFNPLAKYGDEEYGLLYLGIGDGSAALAGYPELCNNNGQIWSSIIRIDPTGRDSSNGKYGIPKSNPYINDSSGLDEIWSRGFRNPHRISWDETGSGRMYISNIGQHSVEEVDLGEMGADHGWPDREGTFLFDVDANTEVVYPLPDDDSGYTYPVIQYDHDEGNAVSGGFIYSGDEVPLLKGKYIFGDIPRGTLFYSEVSEIIDGQQAPIHKMALELNGQLTRLDEISTHERVDLRFGKDISGELFIFTKSNGKVYKVVGCKTDIL